MLNRYIGQCFVNYSCIGANTLVSMTQYKVDVIRCEQI